MGGPARLPTNHAMLNGASSRYDPPGYIEPADACDHAPEVSRRTHDRGHRTTDAWKNAGRDPGEESFAVPNLELAPPAPVELAPDSLVS